ncbi:MAG: adenylate/guanylate cyclase domain-containing protein [Betaproteobacteria bacterium]|nr:adenylate/guanylate cyclase domain-containing protein [Betaproteobacteria bacterium]
MAVLFADITDSTSLYQKLGDVAARNIVNACLGAMSGVLLRHEGRLVKTIGDEVMCVFPSADLAVLAASEMQSLVASTKPGNYPVKIHIGLHFGSVLVDEGDVFGDTVNVAAYLTAVATAEQILTTASTEQCLSAALRSLVRPIFHTVLKGSDEESTVYQVLWRTDNLELTDVNLHSSKTIPGDTGSLLLTLDEERVRVDQWRPGIVIGRSQECDLVVTDRFASREHLSIKLVRTHFYLFDHSINGSFVSLESGEEVHVLRREMPLDGTGQICVGRSRGERPGKLITFARDRRSMFRI